MGDGTKKEKLPTAGAGPNQQCALKASAIAEE